MSHRPTSTGLALLATALLGLTACESPEDAESEMALSDTPPAVAAAVEAAYPGATVLEVERESDTPPTWEIEVQPADGAGARELVVDADGNILEDEED